MSSSDITQLLLEWNRGNQDAYNQLIAVVYDELRRIARRISINQGSGLDHTLPPTALVHEAYERLIDEQRVEWQNRAHFFGIAGRTIRRILIDEYRKQAADKRGGEWQPVSLGQVQIAQETASVDLLALNEVLERLEKFDQRKAQITELRFFSGLQNTEIAEVLHISETTVEREWRLAKAWLLKELNQS